MPSHVAGVGWRALVPVRRRRIVPLRDALAVASVPRAVSGRRDCSPRVCAPRPVASDDRRRDAASRRAALLRRGAASCSVSRWRFDESARRASAYGAAPRSRCRLVVCRAASSRAWRRSSRLLYFGGCVVVLRAFPRGTARCSVRQSRFLVFEVPGWRVLLRGSRPWLSWTASPPARRAWNVRGCCRLPKPRVGSGSHAVDFSVVSLRSGPGLERCISSCGRRLVEGAAIRRPSRTGAGRARGGSHRDRGGRCAPSGCAACQRPAAPRRCSQGRRMRTWRRRPAVTGRPVRRLLGDAFQRLSLSGDMISAPRVYVHTFFLPNNLPKAFPQGKMGCERPPEGGRSQGAK